MDSLDRLHNYFTQFPGIGPRQAQRFVYYLLRQSPHFLSDFSKTIEDAKKHTTTCNQCKRFFYALSKEKYCSICSNEGRDKRQLMVVERDSDLESIEKSRVYNGYYFVLGGTLPILNKNPQKNIRINELVSHLKTHGNEIDEVIIATSYNPEGEGTLRFIEHELEELSNKHSFKISSLGRGLSTGTELEYIDKETMKSALENRK